MSYWVMFVFTYAAFMASMDKEEDSWKTALLIVFLSIIWPLSLGVIAGNIFKKVIEP